MRLRFSSAMFKQGSIIGARYCHLQGSRFSIESILDHRLFCGIRLCKRIFFRLTQVIIEFPDTAVQVQADRGWNTNGEVCTVKVFGISSGRSVLHKERNDLFYRLKDVARCNHSHVEFPIIDVRLRSQFCETGIEAGVSKDHLPGLTLPEQVFTPIISDFPYFKRERAPLR